jgi:hypothetical protein
MTDPSAYPEALETHYGWPVWQLGGEEIGGLMAAGHGRRSLAALSACRRSTIREYGRYGEDWETAPAEAVWVVFVFDCGCSKEEHAWHERLLERENYGEHPCRCDRVGLPPCTEPGEEYSYEWVATTAAAETPGALPVVRTKRAREATAAPESGGGG